MNYLTGCLLIFFISCTNNSQNRKQKIINNIDTLFSKKKYKIISDSTNVLEKKIQTIELQYTLWGCACPNWIKTLDAKKQDDSNFLNRHIFIEPENSKLYFPDSTFDFGKETILVTGQFYQRKDYPKGTIEMEEPLEKAKVFRYTKIKVVKRNGID